MSNAPSLGRKRNNFQQLPAGKYMPKIISDHTEKVALCKNVELCKLVLEVFSFHI